MGVCMKYVLPVLLLCRISFGCEGGKLPAQSCDPRPETVYEVSERTQIMSNDLADAIKRGELPRKTNGALNAMVRFAAYKLKAKGYKTKAKQLLNEWEKWDGYLVTRGLGDHAPLSKWLAEKTSMLELILGTEVMKATRLYDLVVINYAIPVVFRCIDNVDEPEYSKHFVPLCGVTAYWLSFFGCVGATWGTGFLFCSPLSMGVEYLTINFAAPRLNNWAWRNACVPGVVLPEFIPQEVGEGFIGGSSADMDH
jgi:hypothetical protein